jgi:hypothetical protein
VKFLLLCEGAGDDEDLHHLTLNVLRHAHNWLKDHDELPWVEMRYGERFLKWGNVAAEASALNVPPVLRAGRGIGYAMARRALNLLSVLPAIDLTAVLRVVMVHDSDHTDGWFESLAAARDEWLREERGVRDIDVAIGIAHPEHEAWPIAVFEVRAAQEQKHLEALRSELGFDPTREPHRLRSGRSTHTKDAKRVLATVTAAEPARRRTLLLDAPIDLLIERGKTSGLADFVVELLDRAATAYGPVPPQLREALLSR